MYFVLIIAFALLLTDGLPLPGWDVVDMLLRPLGRPFDRSLLTVGLLASIVPALGFTAWWLGRRACKARDGTPFGEDEMESRYSFAGWVLNCALAALISGLLLFTGWLDIVRSDWGLGRWPLLAELVILAPFLAAMIAAWICLYPIELEIRTAVGAVFDEQRGAAPRPWRLPTYLIYKIRHQILTVLIPMAGVLLCKYAVQQWRDDIVTALNIAWAPDALLGLMAATVLVAAPVMLRYLWATRPLPPGPLRDRLEALCRRVGLRYREILVWDSQNLVVNAAVMGLFSPVRYILLSDGMLFTMTERQIEAVFGHEAGHVRRHHLLFFGIFALLSMLIVGGLLELLVRWTPLRHQEGLLQLVALAALTGIWGLAFGFISRKFERQADLYGVRCVTEPLAECERQCLLHTQAEPPRPTDERSRPANNPGVPNAHAAVCATAVRLFGRTLVEVAHLNGIPLEAESWRHGSIQSRCDLLVRFAHDPAALIRFESGVERIKAVLLGGTLIGSAIAAWLYWPF